MEQLQQLQQMYESLTTNQMYIVIGVLALVVISIVMTAVYFMYPSSNKQPPTTNSGAQHSELPDIDSVDMVVSEIDDAQANEQQNQEGHNEHDGHNHDGHNHEHKGTNEHTAQNEQQQHEQPPHENSEQSHDVIEPIAQ